MKASARLYPSSCAAILAAVSAAPAGAGLVEPGVYRLHNHSDGGAAPPSYGLRLDELFDVTPDHDVFTFDFDRVGAAVFMEYDEDAATLRISGVAFGGLDVGGEFSLEPGRTSMVALDFVYSMVEMVAGDDDLIVTVSAMTNAGTITWLDTGQVINLVDKPNEEGYSFRFGNEDDDLGHRGFDGLSGWGWLVHGDLDNHVVFSDWLFTAEQVPAPAAAALLAAAGVRAGRRRRR